jgi:hypothetical protein
MNRKPRGRSVLLDDQREEAVMSSDAWLPPDSGGVTRTDEERAVDIGPEEAEEFAEDAGVDPTPQQVEEYVDMQRRMEPPD